MNSMTIQELYDHLSSPEFRKVGINLSYNYYIWQYPACDEYKMRKQIVDFKQRLERPANYINALLIDLFDLFCDYLRFEPFGAKSLYEEMLEEDRKQPNAATKTLMSFANSDNFVLFVNQRIKEHISQDDGLNKPYIFIYGIGKIYPYLRTNAFLVKYEKYNNPDSYKIILFYPGNQEGNSFSLFGLLEDDHAYRASLLVNQ